MKRPLLALGLLVLLLSPLACGSKGSPVGTATVSGKVLLDKYPLAFGAVQFYDPGQERFFCGLIGKDGAYKLMNLPEGPFSVCIRTKGELFADRKANEKEMQEKIAAEMKNSGMKEFPKGFVPPGLEGSGNKGKAGPGFPGKGFPGKGPGSDPMAAFLPTVNGEPVLNAFQGLPMEALKVFFDIHDKYGDFKKTPLTYTVLPGEQTHDIILTK